MALQPGDSFGRYDVTGRLGRGGMGVVLAAVHRDLDRPVALKVLAPHLADDAAYRARFLREAKALARLDSPNVVRVFDAGEEDGALFIATELVTGGDLNQLLRDEGPLFLADAVALVRDLALGLGTAHDVGILHRDIKPSNVLVARQPDGRIRPVLCDFGIAAVADLEQLATTGAVGTPGYMAPERHQGADATAAADIYALGCVLWAALTARAPYEGATGQVLLGHLQGPVPQLPASSADAVAVNEVLAVAMAKDPAERFGTTAELVAALDAVPLDDPEPTLVDTGPPTRPRPAPAPPAGRPRRFSWPVGLVVLALLALVVGAAAWALTRSDPTPSARADAPTEGVAEPESDPLVAAFPRAAGCTEVADPKPTRVRASWCHDEPSAVSVHYTQWRDWGVMDANYRRDALRSADVRDDLEAAWVAMTKADGRDRGRKLAVWYAERGAPYSVTVYAPTEAEVLDVFAELDLRPGAEVARSSGG